MLMNRYAGDINEAKILSVAGQFVSLGLKDAGYEYVNIDVGVILESASKSPLLMTLKGLLVQYKRERCLKQDST